MKKGREEKTPAENSKKIEKSDKKMTRGEFTIGVIQIIAAVVSCVVAFISLWIAFTTKNIAEKTYAYASLGFSIIPEVTKQDENLIIKNIDNDSFKILTVDVRGFDEWLLNTDTELRSFNLCTFYYMRDIYDTDKPNLDNLTVDLSKAYQLQGKQKMNEVEQNKFKDAYEINMASLQSQYDITFNNYFYIISIEYFNNKSYRSDTLELRVILDDSGEIQIIEPNFKLDNMYNFVRHYDSFKYIWDRFNNAVNECIKVDKLDEENSLDNVY